MKEIFQLKSQREMKEEEFVQMRCREDSSFASVVVYDLQSVKVDSDFLIYVKEGFFERNNPYGHTDESGHCFTDPFTAAFCTGAGIEIGIQVAVAGDVYSWQRVGKAGADAVVTTAILTIFPSPVAKAAEVASTVKDVQSSYEEAKKHEGYAEQFALEIKPSDLNSDVSFFPNFFSVQGYTVPYSLANGDGSKSSSTVIVTNDGGQQMRFSASAKMQEKFKQAGLSVATGGGNKNANK